ncbi:MAG: hypothetical protein OEY41_11590 [Acidimicrobiia bacterium]|nr:hypothetical protein [Acidimicrobiia bacterium]
MASTAILTDPREMLHMSKTRALAAALSLTLLVAACGSDSDTATEATTGATTATSQAAATTAAPASSATTAAASATTAAARVFPETPGTLALAESSLGTIVVDGEGNALYLFLPDKQGESTCYDKCEAAWPVTGKADGVGDGLDASLLGTTTRTDGSIQATYNKWPLYYFVNDKAPGDVNGQTLNDAWYVLDAKGEGIGIG